MASSYGEKAMKGASVGSSFGPWGALIGAGGGIMDKLITDNNGPDWLRTLNDPLGIFGDGPEYDPEEDYKNQARAIEMTQYGASNPYGTVNWTGSIYDGTRQMNTTFSPGEQAKYDATIGMLGELNSSYGDEAAKRAEQAVYDTFSRQNTPIFEKQLTDLQTRLVNQGIPAGSAAYNRAIEQLYSTQNNANLNALNQSVLTGNQVQSTQQGGLVNLYNAINGSIVNPASGYTTDTGAIQSTYWKQYQQEQADQAAKDAQIMALTSSLGSAVKGMSANSASSFAGTGSGSYSPGSKLDLNYGSGSYLGSYLQNNPYNGSYMYSDARIKENIEPIGKLFNGLTVYMFNFKGENTARIGLIAQEVAQLIPEAVFEDAEGLLCVDYDLACQPAAPEAQQYVTTGA
jgi:hypothetical protein